MSLALRHFMSHIRANALILTLQCPLYPVLSQRKMASRAVSENIGNTAVSTILYSHCRYDTTDMTLTQSTGLLAFSSHVSCRAS
jgi:hypothetical protein